ncbi:MAG: HEAT repeat domain-containing protein [Elusimicrobia bacterium]|nr:HEAT repeat domain-containing protein [Elusimicrobiota bacterium]
MIRFARLGFIFAAALAGTAGAAPLAPSSDADFAGALRGAIGAVQLQAAQVRASINSSDIVDLLRDRDAAVRQASLVNARDHMGDSRVRDVVRDMLRDGNETAGVRREAARTLHWAAHYSEVRDTLVEVARYRGDAAVRAMAFKSLFFASNSDSDVRDRLIDAARYESDPVVRKAALWALFDSTNQSEVVDVLSDVAFGSREDEDVRIEALKSLYSAMNRSEVRGKTYDLARYASDPKALRVAAVLALSAAAGDSGVRDLLEDMARRESDQDLRVAAIKAQSMDVYFFRTYFHLGYRAGPHGPYVSPIVNE